MLANEEIEKIKRELKKQEQQVATLEKMLTAFPDLQKHTTRWSKELYYSATVNETVEDFEWRKNCGCCVDTTIEVFMHKNTEHGKIYADPPIFTPGRFDRWGEKVIGYHGWRDKMRKAKIPEVLIERVGHLIDRDLEKDEETDW